MKLYIFQSYETIVVLCEDTRELSPAISQIDEANPRLLDGVFFLSGYARNPEHLKVCGVETARVITVIHHPRVAEVFEECLDTSSSRMVNADRHTIIISLSLQMILQQHQLKQQQYGGKNDEHLRPSLMRREPFIGESVSTKA